MIFGVPTPVLASLFIRLKIHKRPLFLEKKVSEFCRKMFGNPKTLGRQESQKPADKSQVEQDLDDFNRKRLEKDLLELQRLIDIHFDERQNDENELGGKIFVRFMSDFNKVFKLN